MQFQHILITGGAGFVGSNLAVLLKEQFSNISVTALDNLKRRGSELNLAVEGNPSGTSVPSYIIYVGLP